MNKKNKILACVDQSQFADHVADYASWAARRMDAPLELLHILDQSQEFAPENDHSGTIGIDAQETLLTELVNQEETWSRAARERGRIFLNRLRNRAMDAGVEFPDVRLRKGALEKILVQQEKEVSLFVLGRRGESADTTRRDLGRNVEGVVRALRKSILTVTEGFREPHRVMIAFDGSLATRKGVDMVASSPLFKGLPVHLLMSGKQSQDGHRQLGRARETLEAANIDVTDSLIPGDAESIIARTVQEKGIDLLVMGAYGHSPLRSLFFGSKTSDLLRSATIPTLLIR
jgi:nucleotide-binding universal stress UspA family protein